MVSLDVSHSASIFAAARKYTYTYMGMTVHFGSVKFCGLLDQGRVLSIVIGTRYTAHP